MSESEQEKSRHESERSNAELLLGLKSKNASEKRKRESKKKEYESEYAEESEDDGNEVDNSDSETQTDEDSSGSKKKKSKSQKSESEYKWFGKLIPANLTTKSIRVNNKDNYALANLALSSVVNTSIHCAANDEAATKYFKSLVAKAKTRADQFKIPYQDLVFNCVRHSLKKGVDKQISGFNLLIKQNFLGTAHYLLRHMKSEQKDWLLNLLDEMITHNILGFSIYEETFLCLKTRLNTGEIESDDESSNPESSPVSAISQQTTTDESKEKKAISSNKEDTLLPFYKTTYRKNGKEQSIHITTDFVNSLKAILLGKEDEQDQTAATRVIKASKKIDDFFKDKSEAIGFFAYNLGRRISRNPLDPDKGLSFFAFLIKYNFLEINEKIIDLLEYKEHADQLMKPIKELIKKDQEGFKNLKEHYLRLEKRINDRNLKSNPELQKKRKKTSSSPSVESSHLIAVEAETSTNINEEKNGGEKRKAETQLYNNIEEETEISSSISLSGLNMPAINNNSQENKEVSSFKKRKKTSLPYYKRTYLNETGMEVPIQVPRDFVNNLKFKILVQQGKIPESMITEISEELDEIFEHPEPDSLAVLTGKYRNLDDNITLFTFLIEHNCLTLIEKFIDKLTNQNQADLLMRPVKNIIEKQLPGFQKYEKGYNYLLGQISKKRLPIFKAKQTASIISSGGSINQTLSNPSSNPDAEMIDLTLREGKKEQPLRVESSSLTTVNTQSLPSNSINSSTSEILSSPVVQIIETTVLEKKNERVISRPKLPSLRTQFVEAPLNQDNGKSRELKSVTEEESASNSLTIQTISSSSSSSSSNEPIDISLLLQLLRESEQVAVILLRKKLFSNNHRPMLHEWVFQLATQPTPFGISFFTYLIEVNSLAMAEMIIDRLTEEEIKSLFKALKERLKSLDKDKFKAYTDSVITLKEYIKTLGINVKFKIKSNNNKISKTGNQEKEKSTSALIDPLSIASFFAGSNKEQPLENEKEPAPEESKITQPVETKKQNQTRKYAKGISASYDYTSDGRKIKIHTNLSAVYDAVELENRQSSLGITLESTTSKFIDNATSLLSQKLKLIANYKNAHLWAFEIAKQRPKKGPGAGISFLAYLCKFNRLDLAKSVLKMLTETEAKFVLSEIEPMLSSTKEGFKEYAPRLEELRNYYQTITLPTEATKEQVISSSSSNLEAPIGPIQNTEANSLSQFSFFYPRGASPTPITKSPIRAPSPNNRDE